MYDDYKPKIVQNKNGENIKLTFDGTHARAYNKNNKLVCEFIFSEIEEEFNSENYSYLVTHMNSCPPRQGIGTEIIMYVKEVTGSYIIFSSDDGITRGDGSHLTGWGPSFVNSLKRKKIISQTNDEFYDNEE